MQTEARVGVVVEGGGGAQRGLNSSHVDGGARKFAHQSQIGTLSQLLAGGVAGALSKTCTAPLARLTILFQVQGMHSDVATMEKPSIWREASRIVGEEGVRAFWKGNLVTIAHRLPYSSVNFYAYEHYKKLLKMIPGMENHRDNIGTDLCVHFVAGGSAGVTAASATYPLDLVRTRLAAQVLINLTENGLQHFWRVHVRLGCVIYLGSCDVNHLKLYQWNLSDGLTAQALIWHVLGDVGPIRDIVVEFPQESVLLTPSPVYKLLLKTNVIYYRGICHTLQTITKEEGVLGLYKGLGATLLGVGPSIAISFSVYETLRSFWKLHRPDDSTILVSLSCGSLSGIASSTATFPIDLVRRRKQLEGAGGRARVYTTGLFGIFRQIIRNEGFCGLYRGILPEYYKVVPGVGICFMTYETLKKLLADTTTSL